MEPLPTLPDFAALSIAVAGDLIADRDLLGEPTRLSREAPVIVLRHAGEVVRAGGAANAARNLRALGAAVQVIGGVGRDASGRAVLELLERDGIDVSGVETVAGWTTPTKTRVLAAEPRRTPHQVLRIDREPGRTLPDEVLARSAARAAALAGRIDALLVADYEYGGADERLAGSARALAQSGATVVLDPRRSWAAFRGLSALTPNLDELASAVRREPRELESASALESAAQKALEIAAPRWLLVTLGNRGMALFGEGLPRGGASVEASGSEAVVDVSGAGDTAAAVFALALAAGCAPEPAMRVANAAAGVVVMKHGTATCSRAELERALAPHAGAAKAASAAKAGAAVLARRARPR